MTWVLFAIGLMVGLLAGFIAGCVFCAVDLFRMLKRGVLKYDLQKLYEDQGMKFDEVQ